MLGPGSGEGSVVVVEYDGTSPGVGALAQASIAKTDAMRPMRGIKLPTWYPAISLYLRREMANMKPPLPPSERRESPKPKLGWDPTGYISKLCGFHLGIGLGAADRGRLEGRLI